MRNTLLGMGVSFRDSRRTVRNAETNSAAMYP